MVVDELRDLPVTVDMVREASLRIAGAAVRTPLVENADLNARVGARVLLKLENLQRTGSFKFRGAFNRLSMLDARERAAGVVAFSSGNHAQGVAAAAQILGVPATIVMPDDTPAIKVARTRGYGAETIHYDRYSEDRAEIARKLAEERGAVLVPPFDDRRIIAGQGTVGREILSQAGEFGAKVSAVIVNCSGGGLMAGCAVAIKSIYPETEMLIAEPEGYDDTLRSLASGKRVRVDDTGRRSIQDALLVAEPGETTFEINRRLVSGGAAVSEADAGAASAFAFRELKQVIEPGGAAGLAALLSGKIDMTGRTVAVVCSGGNIDPDLMGRLLADYP